MKITLEISESLYADLEKLANDFDRNNDSEARATVEEAAVMVLVLGVQMVGVITAIETSNRGKLDQMLSKNPAAPAVKRQRGKKQRRYN